MKSVLTVIVFWCLSLAVFGQDTLRTDLFGYSTRFYLPEVAAGDTVTLVANNRSAAMVWYMNVGDWGEITILVNETQVIHGGWSLPIKRGFFPVWRGPDPQPAMRMELASGYNTIQFCFKERVSVPVVRAPRMVSWVVIRDSHWSNTDPFLIGALAILVAFNLIVFFFFKERSYLYFALAHSFFVLYMFTVNGYFIAKVYPENPIYNTRVMWFLGNLFYLSYVAFIHNFFGKTSWSRQLLKLLTGMVVISTLLLLLPFHIDPLFKPIFYTTKAIAFLIIFTVFYPRYREGDWELFNVLFLAGASIFVFTSLLFTLLQANLFTVSASFMAANKVGGVIEALLLSIAIVNRVFRVQQKNEQLQAKFQQELELQVTQKTTELHEKNQLLENTLNDKDILLAEVHHRVKNNLQLVSSLLNLHSRTIHDENAKQILEESLGRINAMGIVHHKLYADAGSSEINTRTYLDELVFNVSTIYNKTDQVQINTSADDFELGIKQAIPLGLVITELVTNAFKHAFGQDGGHILVTLSKQENTVQLMVRDDGSGWNGHAQNRDSIGMMIVESMSQQLGGKLEIVNNGGLSALFSFEMHG